MLNSLDYQADGGRRVVDLKVVKGVESSHLINNDDARPSQARLKALARSTAPPHVCRSLTRIHKLLSDKTKRF